MDIIFCRNININTLHKGDNDDEENNNNNNNLIKLEPDLRGTN